MFDVEKAMKESGLSRKEITKIEREVRREFPNDQMMYELHLIRAFMFYEQKKTRK
jgi:hypothetical protein